MIDMKKKFKKLFFIIGKVVDSKYKKKNSKNFFFITSEMADSKYKKKTFFLLQMEWRMINIRKKFKKVFFYYK